MSFTRRKKTLALTAGAAIFAMTIAGCSSDGDDTEPEATDSATTEETPAETGGEPVTLTLATFNTPGYNSVEQPNADYEYDLIQEYMDLNPNVTITYDRKAESGDARTNFFTKLGPGGLADVEMIEVDWMPEVMQYSDLLEDLTSADTEGRWLESKVADATDADGRLIGAGTDVGPEAICYRASLFEEAGLPSTPDEVATLLDGDWANFFEVGQEYTDATGNAFFDSTSGIWQGMIGQINPAYEDADTGEIIATDNADVKAAYDQLTAAAETQSTGFQQWTEDWNAGMSNGDYATMLCPPWMLGVIEGNVGDAADDWNIANVFPNGGGNWGGSWLTVPSNGANVDEAKKLALWLTAPEQQAKAFANAGTYPSQPAAYEDPAVADATNAFFNDAPIGTLFADRAQAVPSAPFKGEFYFQVNTAITDALTRVDGGTDDPTASWDKAVSEIEALG
ncbi:ABC transporter substrate-binding protein [Demequina sp. NBRC 110055]|uniref:ABC transporter substrate-binding protein n=1 Tax=Demequina sp. NBRC 110055 TaxID=1570344 RepID=UPI001F27C815|nr:ABC transporter substrate-binding protein [Demequina sp. NBRC 110055]